MSVRPGARAVAPTSRERLVTPAFLRITTSTFLYFLAVGALLPVLPRYVRGPLHGGDVAVGLTIGSFSVAAVVLRPFVGRLGDRRGRRLLIVAGASVVAGSVAAYHVASSLSLLILLRVLNGAGEALFYVGVASAVNDIAPDERRGEAVSFFSLALYGGLAVGPFIGESSIGGYHFGVAWTLAAVLAALAGGVGAGMQDARPALEPDEPPGRILHPAAVIPGVILAASAWGYAGFASFVTLFALHLGLSGSRYVFLTYSVTIFAVRGIGARIPDRLGPERTVSISLITSAVALLAMSAVRNAPQLYAASALFGLGQALSFPALMTLAVRGAPERERGAVVGSFTAFFDLAYALGPISLGAVAAAFGYRGVFVGAGLVALAGFVIGRRA